MKQKRGRIIRRLAACLLAAALAGMAGTRNPAAGEKAEPAVPVLELPEAMRPYVTRMEFIIGPQRSYPNNCSVLSFGGKTYINMIRGIRESELERRFFARLVELGIPVEIECNRR